MEITAVRKLTPEMRREQTRSYLLDAAWAVFVARGFHEASLDEIAAAAGFSKGAIYSNFGSKADLFLAVADQREHARFSKLLAAAQQPPDGAGLRLAMRDSFRHLVPTDTEWALWQEFELYALRRPELHQQLARRWRAQFAVVVDVLRQHLETTGRQPPVPVEALAHIFVGIFERLARARAVDPEFAAEDVFATLIEFVASIVFDTRDRPDDAGRPVSDDQRGGSNA